MNYKIKDIVQLTAPYGGKIVAIVGELDRPKNRWQTIGMSGKTEKIYLASDEMIARRVGVLDDDAPMLNGVSQADSLDDGKDGERWMKLKSLRSGDTFEIESNGGRRKEIVTFVRLIPRGRKFVFSAENSRGTRYKHPLAVVVV
jgi:hypothetical protein